MKKMLDEEINQDPKFNDKMKSIILPLTK